MTFGNQFLAVLLSIYLSEVCQAFGPNCVLSLIFRFASSAGYLCRIHFLPCKTSDISTAWCYILFRVGDATFETSASRIDSPIKGNPRTRSDALMPNAYFFPPSPLSRTKQWLSAQPICKKNQREIKIHCNDIIELRYTILQHVCPLSSVVG